jgi:predicted site-specific integrase-resolvase
VRHTDEKNANMLGIKRETNMTAKRVATYLRVSTKNHSQNLDTQRLALEEYARNRGFEIVAE